MPPSHADLSATTDMNIDWVRRHCLSFPDATESVQWGNDLVFKIGGEMFSVAALEPGAHWLSFKCAPEEFTELVERGGIVPAPYLARAYWVALESAGAMPRPELERRLREAYDLVAARTRKKRKGPAGRTASRRSTTR